MSELTAILDANAARRKWADDLQRAEALKEAAARKQAQEIKKARRKRQAMLQAHWISGAAAGFFAVGTGWMIYHRNPLLAVCAALTAVAFGLVGAWMEEGL